MSLVVEVFKTDDYVPDIEIPLVPLLRAIFAEFIGPDLRGVVFELYFYQLMDLTTDTGSPAMENLRASHGFVRVRILRDGKLIYQHPHPVRELIGEPLRPVLRKRDPEVTHWGYGVKGPGLESITLSRPAPQVTHQVRVRTGPRPRLTFTVEEMPDPEPPETTLAALGVNAGQPVTGYTDTAGKAEAAGDSLDAAGNGAPEPADKAAAPPAEHPVVIVIPQSIVDTFVSTYPFSDEIEEGGFLAGTVYRDAERPGGYLVHVTAVLPAERTGASMLNFTFTGESFLRVSQQLDNRGGGEKLLGWYHTHLFAATSRSGLSSVDVELHRSTFRRPWQVAALVNVTGDGRVLRFYHGEGNEMTLVPYWPVPGHDDPAAPVTKPGRISRPAGSEAGAGQPDQQAEASEGTLAGDVAVAEIAAGADDHEDAGEQEDPGALAKTADADPDPAKAPDAAETEAS